MASSDNRSYARSRGPSSPAAASLDASQLLNGRLEADEKLAESKKEAKLQTSSSFRASRIPKGIIQIISIGQWWFFNVATVILNKYIFQKMKFEFPLTLSTIHFIISSIGAYFCLRILKVKPLVDVKPSDRWTRVFPMSCVFCVNIALGNVSLSSIPVSFMQTVKSLTPATTIVLQRLVWGRVFDYRIYLSLLPVVGGIVLTSLTELSFVWKGFLAAMASCFATSTKTILAETLLHGKYNFDSMNTVYHMAPYATTILVLPALIFEGWGVYTWTAAQEDLTTPALLLLVSGALAFSLNYSIFYVIQTTSALTFNVAGNMKTAVAISASWWLFRNPMSILNIVGCSITILGCTIYGSVRQRLGARAVVDIAKEEILPLRTSPTPSS